jgi:hypothetical protein
MPTTATPRSTGTGDVDMVTGRKRRGKQPRQQQQQHGKHSTSVKSAAQFAADVALELGRGKLTREETEKIMASVQAGKIRLSVSGEDWRKQVRTQAEAFHPLGALGLPSEAETTAAQAAIVIQSKELKALVQADGNFLEKLKQFEAMPDVELGNKVRPLTKAMGDHNSLARAELQKERQSFLDNLPMFYELKQRLLNPKYRPDLAGSTGRTEKDNLKNYGAADWQDFRTQYIAYSLSQTDKLLSAWKKETKLLGEGVLNGNALTAAAEASAATTGTTTTAGGGKGGTELSRKEVQTAYKADLTDKLIGLINNAKDAPPEKVLQAVQGVAQYEFEAMTPEQQGKCKMPTIARRFLAAAPASTTVENLGIAIAKLIFRRFDPDVTRDFTKKEREDLDASAIAILQAAGVTKVGKMEVPKTAPTAAPTKGKKAAAAAAAASPHKAEAA